MLDFGTDKTVTTENVILLLKTLKETGIIVKTANSFHFIGTEFLDEPFNFPFYGKVLLSGLLDERWFAHQLIEKEPSLRIGRKVLKDGSRLSDLEIVECITNE